MESKTSAIYHSFISGTKKNNELITMNLQAIYSYSPIQKHIFLFIYFKVYMSKRLFVLQMHVSGRPAPDKYNICEYWHLLCFDLFFSFILSTKHLISHETVRVIKTLSHQ